MKKTRSIFRTHSNIYDGGFFCNNSKLLTVFAKILHQRLLNWILDMLQHKAYIEFSWMSMIKLFRNNIYQLKVINYFCRTTPSFDWVSQGFSWQLSKKNGHEKTFSQSYKIFYCFILITYLFCETNPPPPFSVRDQTFMTSKKGVGGEILKFIISLQILLFLNYGSIILFCRWELVYLCENCNNV